MFIHFKYRRRSCKRNSCIIPAILIAGGIIIIICITPTWFWLFLLGATLIILGCLLLKK